MKLTLIVVAAIVVLIAGACAWLYTPDRERAALEAKYGATQADFLETAGIRLHLRDTGPRGAPAVILLHGFGASLQTWDAWAAILQIHKRVIRFDLPGFGLTGADPTGQYTDARAVAVLSALMDRLGIARASLIGNSLGGKIAWMFAAEHPARVDKLVLISPDGFASPGFEYDTPARVPALMRLLPYILPAAMLRMTLAPAYANARKLTPALTARYRDMMLAPGVRRAMLARLEQVRLTRPQPVLARITAPTLLLWGQRDAMIPPSNAGDYLRAIPGARLAALPGLGHVPQEEDPVTSLAPVQVFLNESP